KNDIALQEIGNYTLGRQVDLMFGGGFCHFKPNGDPQSCREDDLNLFSLAQSAGFAVGHDRTSFDAITPDASLPILNLFTPDHMSYEIDRDPAVEPSLAEMATKALGLLTHATADSREGFFLMIEGSRIDMAGHTNDPATHVREILAYQDAIAAVKVYVDANPGTVMISVSDHETGGLSVARQLSPDYPEYLWYPQALVPVRKSAEAIAALIAAYNTTADRTGFVTSTVLQGWLGVSDATPEEVASLSVPGKATGLLETELGLIVSKRAQLGWYHSAVDVNLYAYGMGADRLRGSKENTDIGDFIVKQLSLDLDSITEKLKE
ncbi:alkaline-phosphatase-like protein, partial [Blyttiomyces helicus]